MFKKIRMAFIVLQQGQVVADPATWKNRDLIVSALAALFASLYAMARALGYELPIDAAGLDAIAAGLAAVIWMLHAGATVATSDKVGLPSAHPSPPGRSGGDQNSSPHERHADDVLGA